MLRRIVLLVALGLSAALAGYAQSPDHSGCDGIPAALNCKLLDDFEAYSPGEPPRSWRDTRGRDLVRLSTEGVMTPRKNVYVRRENGNQFARIYTDAKALRVVRSRRNGLSWNLEKRPVLQWKWRAEALPEGANEQDDDRNDTGGAVYVTFDTDWLGRPKSIKYTYSSSLPVGTVVSFGPLKVIVVDSAREPRLGQWKTKVQHVRADYEQVFGQKPPDRPVSITISGDSNTTGDTSEVDIDDLTLLPSNR